jgi:hypothetical protein
VGSDLDTDMNTTPLGADVFLDLDATCTRLEQNCDTMLY